MTVYVPQNPTKLDNATGQFVPRFDLSDAENFGELKYLLSPTAKPFLNDSIIRQLHEGLEDFTSDDFLLLIGNPALIGMVSAIAAQYTGGDIKFLQWGKDAYAPIFVENLFKNELS